MNIRKNTLLRTSNLGIDLEGAIRPNSYAPSSIPFLCLKFERFADPNSKGIDYMFIKVFKSLIEENSMKYSKDRLSKSVRLFWIRITEEFVLANAYFLFIDKIMSLRCFF